MPPSSQVALNSWEAPSWAVESLERRIAGVLRPLIKDLRALYIADFPNHPNVGDSAIYLGELAFFARYAGLQPSISYAIDQATDDVFDAALEDQPILLHGGGNFGDLWPLHHALRKHLLARYSKRRIIQLPQTIFFSDERERDETARLIERHGNFVLLVRDEVSADLARRHFQCEVTLCPDMAFCMEPLTRKPATRDLLMLLRTDKEAADGERPEAVGATTDPRVEDWIEERTRLVMGTAMAQALFAGRLPDRRRDPATHEFLARARVARGVAQLSSARQVITDRLHGHILCVMLGIPHIVIDNSYGKLGSFIESWTKGHPTLRRSTSVSEALAMLERGT